LTSKIHAVVDTNGLPIRLALTAGEAHYNRLAGKLLSRLKSGAMLLADRGSDAETSQAPNRRSRRSKPRAPLWKRLARRIGPTARRGDSGSSAWVASKEGSHDQALNFMRAAADGKDASVKHVAMENRLYPMRELLADLLLEVGQPAAALSEYESAIRQNPNR
jgi:hypothetical protein